ncbi:MAG: invasion associated locus B family protein [Cypionkella sp.]|jgi:invasion protein IalB
MKIYCGLLSMGLTLAASSLAAQAAEQQWASSCEATSCTLSLNVLDAASSKPVSTILVVVTTADKQPLIGAALPLGSALEPGIRIVQGDTTINAKFQVCYPDGCRALAEMTNESLDTLALADKMEVFAFPYSSDKPISFEVPLAGLDVGIKAAREKLAKAP